MADINLLGNTSSSTNLSRVGLSLIVKIITGLLVLAILYYGYLWFSLKSSQKTFTDLQAKTSEAQSTAMSSKDRAELVTRQGQLQNLDSLVKNHVYWSQILPELAQVTVKSTTYASITGDTKGMLNLVVQAPSYDDLDKYLQVFNLPQYSAQFSDVKILSLSKAQEGSNVQNEMHIQLKFNPQVIQSNSK